MSDERRLDLSLLQRANHRLEQSLHSYDASPESEPLRDSVVMRFMFTYELLLQVISRFVELEHPKFTPESEMTRSKIVRRANDLGVLRMEWEEFIRYRDARNSVAHTYNEAKAMRVVELAHSLASEARYVLQHIKEKQFD